MAPPATTTISPQAVIGEFAMNALRLKGGVSLGDFTDRTGLQSADLVAAADEISGDGNTSVASALGLLACGAVSGCCGIACSLAPLLSVFAGMAQDAVRRARIDCAQYRRLQARGGR